MDSSQEEQLKDSNSELYLLNLQNFVYDDEKIVTYKWLSHELSIHIDLSKQLLTQFVTDQENSKNDPIVVTYLLYGAIDDGFQFNLVRDTDLSEAREQFKNVISEQVFSVQRKANIPDLNILYTVDKGLAKDCIGKIGFERDITRKDIIPPRIEAKKELSNGDSKFKTVEKKSGISNMFQNQTKKKVEKEKPEVEEETPKVVPQKKSSPETKTKPTKPVSKGGIANFFSKQSKPIAKPPTENTKEKLPNKENKSITKSPLQKQEIKFPPAKQKEQTPPKHDYRDILDTDDDEDAFAMEVNNVVDEKNEDIKKNKKVEKAQTKRRRNPKDKAGNSAKRRKRIVQYGDSASSDDDIFARDRSESPVTTNKKPQISDDDEPDEIPSTPVASMNNSDSTKKIKKIGKRVDKTYLDEEGFMVTKKEFSMGSGSDTDGENNKKDENTNKNESNIKPTEEKPIKAKNEATKAKNEPKKKSSPKKQSTLMSFFKKS